jgi:hypothetical protein
MSLFSGLKKVFGKNEEEEKFVPRQEKAPVGIRTEQNQNSDHRRDVEEALVRLHRDYLSRKISIDTLLDTLDDLRDKMSDDLVLARSKRLPSTLYGIFTATKDLKIQRSIAEIIHAQSVTGNSDAIRIAKMLNQLAGDPVTKDLTARASKRVVEF